MSKFIEVTMVTNGSKILLNSNIISGVSVTQKGVSLVFSEGHGLANAAITVAETYDQIKAALQQN